METLGWITIFLLAVLIVTNSVMYGYRCDKKHKRLYNIMLIISYIVTVCIGLVFGHLMWKNKEE